MATPRDILWNAYIQCKYSEWFCRFFKRRAYILDTSLLLICGITSLYVVANWRIWIALPVLWGAIVIITQVIQAARPYLPFRDRLTAFKYFLPALCSLLSDYGHHWINITDLSSQEIKDIIQQLEARYNALDSSYLEALNLPMSGGLYKKASDFAAEKCLSYFAQKYNVRGEYIAEPTTTATANSASFTASTTE